MTEKRFAKGTEWTRRDVLGRSALTAGALTAASLAGIGRVPAAAAAGRGPLRIPAPAYDVWDFDDRAVRAWDSDVTAATARELSQAIQTAMRQGTRARPQYHRILWVGGDVRGNLVLNASAGLPDKYGPHILIQGAGPTVIDGELMIRGAVSNCKFRGFRFQPVSKNFAGGKAQCVRLGGRGGGRRLSFAGCQFGAFWRRGSWNTYPEGLGGSGVSGWEITLKDNECRGVFQLMDTRAGWYHLEQNLVTGLIDDFIALTVRGETGPDGKRFSYSYLLGNVILDFADEPSQSGYHCDMLQMGTPTDAAGDGYLCQRYGNVYIGDTYQQYPTMNAIIQQNRGGATRFELDTRDNVILCTGTRGLWLPDRRFRLERDLMGWPPLAGPVPIRGKGWNGGPYRQHLRSSGGRFGRNADIRVGTYLAARGFSDNAGWGAVRLEPSIIADPAAPLNRSTAYSVVFPNMRGLSYASNQVRIPLYTGARTKTAVRNYVSSQYMPYKSANGFGWEANGFYDPAKWF